MATKVAEIRQGAHLPACDGRSCSMHRRPDRVYEDQLWRWALNHPGHRPHDPDCG